MSLCKCGCGQEIIVKKHHRLIGIPDYIHGHNQRCKEASLNTKAKMSATWKYKWADPKYKEKKSGGECSVDTRRKISEAQVGKIVSSETKRKLSIAHLGIIPSNETRQKMSNTRMGRIPSDETREKLRKTNLGKILSIEHKQKLSAAHLGKVVSAATKIKISESGKRLFSSDEHCKKMMKAWKLKPNKPETLILNLLSEMYPNEWKYTGDFSFTINGKNPDFVNCNGQKKCIEFFGDYWHKGENPQDRIDLFKTFGFDTLVIWERELKNMDSVKNKIERFCEYEGH